MPELVSTLCTFLVLAPLALMPGMGEFLFHAPDASPWPSPCARPISSRGPSSPACSAAWLSGHGHENEAHDARRRPTGMTGARTASTATATATGTARGRGRSPGGLRLAGKRRVDGDVRRVRANWLEVILRAPPADDRRRFRPPSPWFWSIFWPMMRREFYPDVDAGAFEMYARAAQSGTRIEKTEEKVAQLEELIEEDDPRTTTCELYISETRRQLRLVGRVHPQRRPDGRGHQGPAHRAPEPNRRRSTST